MASIREFPTSYQFQPLAEEIFGQIPMTSTDTVVCGSPNEVSNDMSLVGEGNFQIEIGWMDTSETMIDKEYQKQTIWTKIAMQEEDQLRQRVAFAIAQIFAITPVNIITENTHTEGYISYYDIFVRHAFGSYFDILKEVSYSAMMAEMLTYMFSKSSAFQWERESKKFFADENYAREVMQLFTIGITMMNMDGSPIIDPNTGAPKLTYTNEHIMSFARAWTGFNRQEGRANIDQGFNRIDPMRIDIEWRDVFPKIDLLGGYIGDGYPLCVDMPKSSYLRKGATFQLLGTSLKLEGHRNPDHRFDVDQMIKYVKLDPNSNLYNKLCAPNANDECTFPGHVVLDDNLACYGQECGMDTLRLFEVGNGIFYEYFKQPCVQLPYYENPKIITWNYRHMEQCADPRMEAAGADCCSALLDDWSYEYRCEYVQERVSYDTAQARCQANNQRICLQKHLQPETGVCDPGCCTDTNQLFFWNDAGDCTLKVKTETVTGKVTIVHRAYDDTYYTPLHLKEDNFNFFPVYWSDPSNIPDPLANNCANGACEVLEDGCLCHVTSVDETAVFASAPNSADDILAQLKIGSVSPDTFDAEHYDDAIDSGSFKTYFRSGASYNIETIFEVTDSFSGEPKYYINKLSTVNVHDENNNNVINTFRNPRKSFEVFRFIFVSMSFFKLLYSNCCIFFIYFHMKKLTLSVW